MIDSKKLFLLSKIFYLWALAMLCISCIQLNKRKDEHDQKKSEVTLYDDKTGVRTVIEVNEKMKANGLYKEYYANGALKRKVNYVGGIKEGWEEQYDSLGRIIGKGHFSKNKQDGPSFWYSKDGYLESKSFWIADRQYGEIFKFYPDKSVKKYYVKDFQGDVFYVADYENQKIVEENGLIFSPAIFITESKNLFESARLLKDTVSLEPGISIGTTVAAPLKMESKLFLTIESDDNTNTREMEIVKNTAVISGVFTKKGKFKLLFRGEMWKDSKLIKTDTLVRQVVVEY